MITNKKILLFIGIVLIGLMGYMTINYMMTPKYDIEYGRRGRDTVVMLGNGKFQIGKFNKTKIFIMYKDEYLEKALLEGVTSYKKYDKRYLYVISKEGYAIADAQTNTCRVVVTIPDEEYTNGWTTGEDGVKRAISRYIEDEHVTYLKSFDDFSEKEQNRFKKMMSK